MDTLGMMTDAGNHKEHVSQEGCGDKSEAPTPIAFVQ